MNLSTFIAAALLLVIPRDPVLSDRVDLIEVNHFHCEQGKEVFCQQLFWDWSDRDGRFHIVTWKLLKSPSMRAQLDYATGDYIASWRDSESLDRKSVV